MSRKIKFKCEFCGKENEKEYRSDGAFRFCNRTCSGKYRARKINKEWDRSGDNNPAWNGGKKNNYAGYVELYKPNHPNAHGRNGIYVFEHRLVMEKYLGRFLNSNERVHHINGKVDDNRIENLELFKNQSEHVKKGHRDLYKIGFNAFVFKKKKKKCLICGKEFVMKSPSQKYCGKESCKTEVKSRYNEKYRTKKGSLNV